MTNRKALTDEEIEWAYKKWCEGRTQKEIADALFVCEQTIFRILKGKPRIRPKLKYEAEAAR